MKQNNIPFNKPYLENCTKYLQQVVASGEINGNAMFTKKCHSFFNRYFGAQTLLTTSGTDALEMATLLADIKPGDEVIVPSFSFVSTANPFLLRGAKVIFADNCIEYPNIDITSIDELITPRTRAVVPVHYGGIACDMGRLVSLSEKYSFEIIEDAAHAIGGKFNGKLLGTFGRFGTLSFHETKNITAGEGGLIILNNINDFERAEIVWEKGTNRNAFHRGEINKYEWVDIGSSFLPSDINAAVLYSQLEELESIQNRRISIWKNYFEGFKSLAESGKLLLPKLPDYASINGHLFFLECESQNVRDKLIAYLRRKGIHAVFHYLPLHLSPFFKEKHDGRTLKNSVRFSQRIIRLPLYCELKNDEQSYIINTVKKFFC